MYLSKKYLIEFYYEKTYFHFIVALYKKTKAKTVIFDFTLYNLTIVSIGNIPYISEG